MGSNLVNSIKTGWKRSSMPGSISEFLGSFKKNYVNMGNRIGHIKKKLYIPVQTNLNLKKVLFIYNNTIIYYNIINLNFYLLFCPTRNGTHSIVSSSLMACCHCHFFVLQGLYYNTFYYHNL